MSLKPSTYDLGQHGTVLATRDLGRQAGRAAADLLADSEAMVLGFWGVEVASPPFLDELMRAIKAVLSGGNSRRLLIGAGLNEDVRETLDLVLKTHGGAMAEVSSGDLTLLGGSRQLKTTLAEAQRLGYFTAPQLAQELELKLPNLHARLRQLAEAGAVARADPPQQDEAPGRQASGYVAPDVSVLTTCAP